MSEIQEIYDSLVRDIKLLVQYDDKYMKIDTIVKPNIMSDLEKKIMELKNEQTNVLLQIKNNNDKKELLEIDINDISIKQIEIEKEIKLLHYNTDVIQREQLEKLELINSKCKELEELIDTIQNKSYQDTVKKILQLFTNNYNLLYKNIFINYIIDDNIENNIIVSSNLELYNKLTIKNLLYDFQLIKELQTNIVINNIKICALENTHIDYRKELKINNIYDNDNYRSASCEHTDFIEFTKLKETIKKLAKMEIEIYNQLEQLKNTDVESIEKHLKLTKMHKDIKNENNDNMIQLSKLEISIKKYTKNRNIFIKKHTCSNQEYFSELTKLISNIFKPIDIDIININIYNEKLLQLEKKAEELHDNIIKLYKFIDELLIDTIKSNHSTIKNIQTFIKKEIKLNTMITENIDIIKEKHEDKQKILTLNTNLDAELSMYNSELSKFQDEYTLIEKVYNLRKLYSV